MSRAEIIARHLIDRTAGGQWWMEGYEAGIERGIAIGRAQAAQEWTDVTSAACRVGLQFTDLAQVQRRRRNLTTEPLTADEIAERSARSWAAESSPMAGAA